MGALLGMLGSAGGGAAGGAAAGGSGSGLASGLGASMLGSSGGSSGGSGGGGGGMLSSTPLHSLLGSNQNANLSPNQGAGSPYSAPITINEAPQTSAPNNGAGDQSAQGQMSLLNTMTNALGNYKPFKNGMNGGQ